MNETTTRMHRGHGGRIVAGVCGALAAQLKLDVTLVRVAFAVTALFSFGMSAGVYVLFWALTPPLPGAEAPAQRWAGALQRFGAGAPSGHPVRDAEGPQI